MLSVERYEPPRPSKIEHVIVLLVAAVAPIPIIGGSIAAIAGHISRRLLDRNRQRWAGEIAKGLRRLENEINKAIPAESSKTPIWDWGDWISFGGEFVSQNPVPVSTLESILRDAGLAVPTFTGHGWVAVVDYETAETCCRLLGGRLPSVEAIEWLARHEPPIIKGQTFEDGWCSYEWTRSPEEVDRRFVVQTTWAGDGKMKYFATKAADIGVRGAHLSFRIARRTPAIC
jgi:hypothetical protein